MLHVRLYTRRGCRGCDAISPMLRELSPQFLFEIEVVDIESDPNLLSQFGCSVPIVTIDGGNRVVRITPERLRAAMVRALERRQPRDSA